jgi:hypothetical protein
VVWFGSLSRPRVEHSHEGSLKEMRRQRCFSGAAVIEDFGGEFVTIECEYKLDLALLCGVLPGQGWVVP